MAPKETRPWTHLSWDTDLGLGWEQWEGEGRSRWTWDPRLVGCRAHEDTERPGERGTWQCTWSAPFREGNTAENSADLTPAEPGRKRRPSRVTQNATTARVMPRVSSGHRPGDNFHPPHWCGCNGTPKPSFCDISFQGQGSAGGWYWDSII